MRSRILFVVGCIAVGLALYTAGFAMSRDLPEPGTPRKAVPAAAPQGTYRNIDEEFAALARQIPGFGGFAFDDSGNMIVHLKDPAQEALARQVLAPYLDRWPANPGESGQRSIVVRQAQFDFPQLNAWREQLRPVVLGLRGAVGLDVHEGRNRIVIGVSDLGLRDQITTLLSTLNIPTEAVVVEQEEPAKFAVTLNDRVRPIVGGLYISLGSGGYCTLGFNATRGTDRGFVTNSHCTATRGGVEGTTYYQPNPTTSAVIGTEAVDPQYYAGTGCPTGFRCRSSDAAFVRYSSTESYTLGQIARTTSVNTGVLDIDPTRPRFSITGEELYPALNVKLNKVGVTTGWTSGSVTVTCKDMNTQDASGLTDIVLRCQDFFTGRGQGGDSGSPVFWWDGANSARLYGIMWGYNSSGIWFSSLGSIKGEVGHMTTY